MILHGGDVGGVSVDVGDIGHSLRLRSSASCHLTYTNKSTTNRLSWAVSLWVKRGTLGAWQSIFAFRNASNVYSELWFDNADHIQFSDVNSDTTQASIVTNAVYRDPSSWIHLLLVWDSANATSSDRVRLYVNGVRVSSFSSAIYPGLSVSSIWNYPSLSVAIGRETYTPLYQIDAYIARFCQVDGGGSLDATSFGYMNSDTNEWVTKSQSEVKAVVDAGGANSFMLDFDNGTSLTTLGYDKSANGNNWTLNNVSLTVGATYDWMLDVPGNSYCTLNTIETNFGTLSNGNLSVSLAVTGTTGKQARGTIRIPSTGKWYFRCKASSLGVAGQIGIIKFNAATNGGYGTSPSFSTGDIYVYASNGQKGNGTSTTAYGATYTTTNEITVEVDSDAGTISFSKDGVSQGVAYSGIILSDYFFVVHAAGAVGTVSYDVNFGQQQDTPPTGFKALSQANLSDGETITTSGSFTGNLNADGPYVDLKGTPTAMTINGNAVTFGTHADKTAFGFKVRSASSSYNNTGSNTYSITSTGPKRKYALAKANP